MMKQFVLIAIIAFVLAGCNNKKTETAEAAGNDETLVAATGDLPTFELDELLNVADKEVDKTVKVTGYVTHTCKHAGKRCFIVGESQKASMRIEAEGNIGGFNRELVGSKIAVTGTVKERRLSQEYINQMEKDVNVKKQEDGTAESCQAEISNIKEMRQWMKEHNKDYYAIYYLDGQDYEVLE